MKIVILFLLLTTAVIPQSNTELQLLARNFFEWRKTSQPITGDDIPRIERPNGWYPDYSPQTIKLNKNKYLEFRETLRNIDPDNFLKSDSVDYLLIRSAIERVNWELNILKLPNTHPEFYIDQTLGSVFDLLVISSRFDKNRSENLQIRINAIPKILEDAKLNLSEPIKPFAEISISLLEGIEAKLDRMTNSLIKLFPNLFDTNLKKGVKKAAEALVDYSDWLKNSLPSMKENIPVGRENYNYFLKNIALVPYTPEELLKMGRIEWQRAVTFETLEIAKNSNLPKPKMFNTVEEEIEHAKIDESAIRDFLISEDIMSVPTWTKNYTLKEMPEYIEALADFGELDDFTSPTRLDENSVRYIPKPSEKLGYFYRTAATDPRPLIIHEGTPGHYFQLIQSWNNPNYIRRFYYDSNANEGVGFYLEEMMLQLGLFENKPQTREVIYSFMRLRALRVEVDINLALGHYSIADAGNYLASTVPMDVESATQEAAFFALTPGQAITYQIGKIQIHKLISDAKIEFGDKFNLKDYHDYMMVNGNVPIALQRWEYLGLNDEIIELWD